MAQLHNGCRFQNIRILEDQEIGRGAYGMVCKAQCDGLLCAAKLLHTMVACDWTIQSFHQECKILSSLTHPNIIQYLGTHDEGSGNPVLLMELMDSSLTSFLEGSLYPSSSSPSLPPFPFRTEVNLCHDISLALAYLHSNDIIHRDLSSNNVLLTKDKRAKVTDFGMSKLMGTDRHMSRLTQVPGCAVYMPPEALMDKPVYTNKLDSFSYGVLAIQILTRKFPAPGPLRRTISDPKYGPIPIEVRILEPERRKSHIDLVDPAHPILKVALACLSYEEKDRPSSGELCSQVGEMKESSQHAEGVRQEAEGTLIQKDNKIRELERTITSTMAELAALQEKLELEQKITQAVKAEHQKELMEAFRKKSELADKVLEQIMVVKEKESTLVQKDNKIRELERTIASTMAELAALQEKLELEQKISQAVKAEHQNLQVQFMKQMDKVKELETENDDLRQQLLLMKAQAADDIDINAGMRKRKNEWEQAVKGQAESVPVVITASKQATSSFSKQATSSLKRGTTLAIWPSLNVHQFDAHESDVSALCFSPDGTCLATGGSDKVVKVWTILKPDVRDGNPSVNESVDPKCAVLSGSKASIMSVQFDPQCKMVLAASNDNTARIWTVPEGRSKHILEGHTGKVLGAKFIADETHKVVTGSHDRTLKIWDLSQKTCLRTLFAGSGCNDVIAGKGMGSSIVSGHLDKRIRCWDSRSTSMASEIALPGKITSLDHNPDRQLLLCCSRDDSLRLIDLRQNAITSTFSTNGFKVGEDWSRACFSPDGQYVAAGSADGSVFVWEVASGRMKSKKEHTGTVVVCGWHPSGQLFASADRSKKVVLWKR